jgi:hypothetical protein
LTGKDSGDPFGLAPDPLPLIQTTTSLTPSSKSAADETTISLTAMVVSTTTKTTPTGSAEFFNGASALGKVKINATGQAVFEAKALALGTNALTAKYLGDPTHAPSTSAVEVVTITADLTETTLAASPTSGPVGTPITLTATVKLKSGTIHPAGKVTFKAGATVLGTGTVGSNGEAVLKITTLKAGKTSIAADYAGDSTDKASASNVVTVTIS